MERKLVEGWHMPGDPYTPYNRCVENSVLKTQFISKIINCDPECLSIESNIDGHDMWQFTIHNNQDQSQSEQYLRTVNFESDERTSVFGRVKVTTDDDGINWYLPSGKPEIKTVGKKRFVTMGWQKAENKSQVINYVQSIVNPTTKIQRKYISKQAA